MAKSEYCISKADIFVNRMKYIVSQLIADPRFVIMLFRKMHFRLLGILLQVIAQEAKY